MADSAPRDSKQEIEAGKRSWMERYRDYERRGMEADKLPIGQERLDAFAKSMAEWEALKAEPDAPKPPSELEEEWADFYALVLGRLRCAVADNRPGLKLWQRWLLDIDNGIAGALPETGPAEFRDRAQLILRLQAKAEPAEVPEEKPAAVKPKRSTERGEGKEKLIAALTKHHQYADGGCLNHSPIGNNELARLAGVAKRTASTFFADQFNGHSGYRVICANSANLLASLKLLNQEFTPADFLTRIVPTEATPTNAE